MWLLSNGRVSSSRRRPCVFTSPFSNFEQLPLVSQIFFFLSLQTSNVLCHSSNWRKASAIATRETRPSSHVKSHTRRRFAFAFCVCASLNVFQPKVFDFEFCVSNTWDVSRTAKQNRKNKCCGCDIYQRLTMSGRTVGKKKLFLAERKAGRWQR